MSTKNNKLARRIAMLCVINERNIKGNAKKNNWRITASPEDIWSTFTPGNAGQSWAKRKKHVINLAKDIIKQFVK